MGQLRESCEQQLESTLMEMNRMQVGSADGHEASEAITTCGYDTRSTEIGRNEKECQDLVRQRWTIDAVLYLLGYCAASEWSLAVRG